MGDALSVPTPDLPSDPETHGLVRQAGVPVDGEALSVDQRRRMHETIADAHALVARPSQVTLPWEQPSMQWIFGDRDPLDFPDVAPVWGYVEPGEPSDRHHDMAIVVESKPTVFESAISFGSFRTCHLKDSDQLSILSQKFEALLSIN
eukprot:s1511_g20.t1